MRAVLTMGDPRTLLRVLDEFLWALRREDFAISTAQAIAVAQALEQTGIENPGWVRSAIASVVVWRAADRRRFDAVFDAFFNPDEFEPRNLWRRLAARGFDSTELDALRWLLNSTASEAPDFATFATAIEGGAELDRILVSSGIAQSIDAHSALQVGFETHRLLRRAGLDPPRRALTWLRSALADALGRRGEDLADALGLEIDRAGDEIRSYVRRILEARTEEADRRRHGARAEAVPFASLTQAQAEEVRRALQRLADRLRGRARVRARRGSRGRLDPHATIRASQRTAGVPFELRTTRRRRERPKVMLLCDVSDSVRPVARFLLEFAFAVQDLFDTARTFVFVSDLGETTALFKRESVEVAITQAWRGAGIVGTGDISNYGRVLRSFADRHLRELDGRTLVVILGDGRTNYREAAPEVLDRIRQRARALLWLCPESRGQWAQGDSAMRIYAPRCTEVYEVGCAADVERVARRLVG
jgi:uncharacterized protein